MDGTLTSLGEYFHGASRFARRTRRFLPKQDYPELVLQKAPYGAKYRKLRPVPAPRREGLHDEVAARCHQRRYIPEQPKVGILDRDNEVRRSRPDWDAALQVASDGQESLRKPRDLRHRGQGGWVVIEGDGAVAEGRKQCGMPSETAAHIHSAFAMLNGQFRKALREKLTRLRRDWDGSVLHKMPLNLRAAYRPGTTIGRKRSRERTQ